MSGEDVQRLAAELFEKVQAAQGEAYVSDGEGGAMLSRAEFFELVRVRLQRNRDASRIMAAWLKKYGEPTR